MILFCRPKPAPATDYEMIDTIYFEEQVAEHPTNLNLFKRFSQAERIPCNHHKEVFNPSGQNFRIQKKKPADPCPKLRKIGTSRSSDLWDRRGRKLLFLPYAQLSL